MMLWVDDCLLAGPKEKVVKAKNKLIQFFDCKDIGELKEYVGCLIEERAGYE